MFILSRLFSDLWGSWAPSARRSPTYTVKVSARSCQGERGVSGPTREVKHGGSEGRCRSEKCTGIQALQCQLRNPCSLDDIAGSLTLSQVLLVIHSFIHLFSEGHSVFARVWEQDGKHYCFWNPG